MVPRPASSVEPTRINLDESFCVDGPPCAEDAHAHRSLAVDDDAARFLGWSVEEARAQPDSHYEEVVRRFVRDWQEGARFNFTIRRRRDGMAVGALELRPVDGNVSYVVASGFRGQGLATRAVTALLAWAARELRLERVRLTCHVENRASRRVAEKCGFVLAAQDGDQLRFSRILDAVEILDPEPSDPRLTDVAEAPSVWAEGDVLTIAVRGHEAAPDLIGTVHECMRAAGDGVWALRLRTTLLDRAIIEYRVVGADESLLAPPEIWRAPRARGPKSPDRTTIAPLEEQFLGESEIALTHPVKLWAPSDPQALLVCTDGAGLDAWASIVAAAGERVALVGVDSAGLTWKRQELTHAEMQAYDPHRDPRARAYLPSLDPQYFAQHMAYEYFAQHMAYVMESVLPWAEAQVGPLPRLAFGVSNGAAWAAAAGARPGPVRRNPRLLAR